ncbi:MAG: polysaccharide biosynthesis C-terminal domain-containing protein [Clostridia bacterium]|nr:polysaccharide biosynthesis C-terminal domain-containing protein [Clostridia bacterium]
MRKKTFILKVAQMSLSMIILNLSGIAYSIFTSGFLPAHDIGLFHLIMNIFSVGVSLSVSGISLTVTRLLSDMPGDKAMLCSGHILKKCMKITLFTSSLAATILFLCSDILASGFIKTYECHRALKFLAPTLICVGISAPINGYFIAFGKVWMHSLSKICAEVILWTVTLIINEKSVSYPAYMTLVIALSASVAAETICALLLWYKNRALVHSATDESKYSDIVRLCAPIAVGSYMRTGLTSAENLLVPIRLRYAGTADALSLYGILKGMAMPVLMSANVFVLAFCTLIVPEIARRRSINHINSIRYISEISIQCIFRFGFCVSVIFMIWHNEICMWFFSSHKACKYLEMLSFLPILMFSDSITDSILKGLDQQNFSLKVNIIDSVIRVILIYILIPLFNIEAYIFILYFSEIFNLTLSYMKLKKITALRFSFVKAVIFPLISAVLACFFVSALPHMGAFSQIIFFVILYIIFNILTTRAVSAFRQEHSQGFLP